jgi:glycosyltransferase involved in cell wall biosynthesis
MNIIIFINSLAAGGAERVTVNLANFWVKRGWSVKIVTLSSPNLDFYWIDPKVKRASLGSFLKGNYFFSRFINNLHRILLLRCLIHKDQPKIALSMMSTANILLAFSGFFLRGPVLIGSERIHPPSQPMNHVWEFLRKYAYKYLAGIVALTEESKMWLIQNTRARCIRVIPNIASYPLVELHPRVELPESLRGKKILLSVGRLEKQKGYDVLIDIFKSFSNRFSDWYLVILGEGP